MLFGLHGIGISWHFLVATAPIWKLVFLFLGFLKSLFSCSFSTFLIAILSLWWFFLLNSLYIPSYLFSVYLVWIIMSTSDFLTCLQLEVFIQLHIPFRCLMGIIENWAYYFSLQICSWLLFNPTADGYQLLFHPRQKSKAHPVLSLSLPFGI